jgi:anthranilate synthase/aminodeoxychorismate synthase-like glutamine amidotransferase
LLTLIDNFDSFTYNLVHAFLSLGAQVQIIRYDELSKANLDGTTLCVIGPGPGSPKDVPLCKELIRTLEVPILGICLGHQCIAEAFGGKVVRAKYPMHGKKSAIKHDVHALFRDVQDPLFVARYHSLVVEPESLPDCLGVSATTTDGEVMAIYHKRKPIFGLQFHPESCLSPQGHKLLNNFLHLEISHAKLHPLPSEYAV